MNKNISIVFIFLIIVGTCFSQKKYFQQEVNYKIDVKLNDSANSLDGYVTITYVNNSDDTLNFIYFHLWPNAYKNNKTALVKQQIDVKNFKLYNASSEQRGFIDSLNFKVNSRVTPWEYDENNIDICKVFLENHLLPNDSVKIETPFFVKIPDSKFSRLGHKNNAYFITQWYPKPAVYDNKGWHQMPYLDMGEFYSEFGKIEVSITVPKNYIIAATGNLQNKDELQLYDSLAKNYPNVSKLNYDDGYKNLTYKENNIHDFAWFADKNFNINKSQVILPHSKDTVTTWTFFTNRKQQLWEKAINYVNDGVYYYSLWNGDYPYKNCSAVDGYLAAGGGMEYPTITIIGFTTKAFELEQVIVHEVGHNWWYGILASNERDYPWIDEGINSFYDYRYTLLKYPNLNLFKNDSNNIILKTFSLDHLKQKNLYELGYQFNARRNLDQTSNMKSDNYYAMNYGVIVYMKVAFAFNYLRNYLGDEEFDKIMREFYYKWKFKHPQPYDIFTHFKNSTDKEISWFNDLISTNGRIDYKICNISNKSKTTASNDSIYVKFKNKGNITSPFLITSLKENIAKDKLWIYGFTGKKEIAFSISDFDKLIIDNDNFMPDINKTNNTIKKTGIFKKIEPLKFQFLASLENQNKTQIYYLPTIAWNRYNGFMAGGVLYNSIIPIKKFEYTLMPMYSFINNKLSGMAQFNYNIFPYSAFQFITLKLNASSFGISNTKNYNKIKPEIEIKLKAKEKNLQLEKRIILNSVIITNFEKAIFNDTLKYSIYYNIKYFLSDNRIFNPYSFSIAFNGNENYLKASIEAKYKISYQNHKKGLELRFFTGKFLYSKSTYYGNYNFRMSGQTGYQDYMAEEIFSERFENVTSNSLFAHQMILTEGGFSIYSPLGQSNDWISAININTSIPGKLPLKLYFNSGTYSYTWSDQNTSMFIYEAGVELRIIKGICSIYFPAILSKELRATSELIYTNYLQRVRFTLNLTKLNPFKYTKEFIL